MRQVFSLRPSEIVPPDDELLAFLDVPATKEMPLKWQPIFDAARRSFESMADVRAVWLEVSKDRAAEVVQGEGRNAETTPLDSIIPDARWLKLFVLTAGAAVSGEVERLQMQGDVALAVVLDGLAGLAVDRAVQALERRMETEMNGPGQGGVVLAYSPGYCGWHISGQRQLFAALQPDDAGIELSASCVMKPLKSASGVLIGAPVEVHDFEIGFDFCSDCATLECRDRIGRLHDRVRG